jgi:hypothetical protein
MMPEGLRVPATPLRQDPAAVLRRNIQCMARLRDGKKKRRRSGQISHIQT